MSPVASARYIPHDSPVVNSETNLDKTALGRRDSISPEKSLRYYPTADMNEDLNPHALPFHPGGGGDDPRLWNRSRNEYPPPSMPPFAHPDAPWNRGYPPPPPPPPPQFFTGSQYQYGDFEAQQQAQAHEAARAFHQQWTQNWGHAGPGPQPHFQPPMYPQQHHPPHFPQQAQQPPPPRHRGYPHPAHFQAMQQASWPTSATNEEIQAPAQPPKKSKKSKAKAKAKAAANSEDAQDAPEPATGAKALKKGRYGDKKIMLPAPQPTDLYLSQAAEEPTVIDPPGHVLVILDLNNTVLYRPNKNAKTMIARPYLRPFLRYLFQNFKVMVWSSAKPVNVKSLVEQALDKDLRSMLVASWARDTFGLSATNFNQNVQVYKNLRLIWSRDQIQQHHPEYEAGRRFGQHNTVLIDDSALKASAQPHNLLEIPEFEATPEQMESDEVLREVAGYLEVLRQQSDISKFIHRQPFKAGLWSYEWPNGEAAGGGDMKDKVTLKGTRPAPQPEVLDVVNSMSAVSLGAAQAEAQM